MMKKLVTYCSASGVTKKVAEQLAEAVQADLFEIVPEKPYTEAELNWRNPVSRCNREFFGKKDVPVAGKVERIEEYDVIYVGFPIWYGVAPNVVNTFLKGYDLSGKKIAVFATSGGSGIGKTAEKLEPYVKGAEIVRAERVPADVSAEDLKDWA